MNRYLKCASLTILLSGAANAGNTDHDYRSLKIPTLHEVNFNDPEFNEDKKNWTKLKRKVASEMTFSQTDMSEDLRKIRDEWLTIGTGAELEMLLKKSYSNFNSYSDDSKYFLAQMHTALPLQGILWKLRPLFENSKGFLGNKSTHVTAVQAVRGAISALKMMLPTKQTEAMIQYFSEPSIEMSKNDQFKSVESFQNYLVESVIPSLNEAIKRVQMVSKNNAQKIYVWDNKMIFGRATFQDDLHRFSGHGPAEMNFVLATLYRAAHNILIYCAYNQEASIKVAGQMGSHLGVDSSIFASKRDDLGLTDEERVRLIRKAASVDNFLELRNYQGTDYGSRLMRQAYLSLRSSVVYAERSFEYLQVGESSKAMSLNPILYQPEVSPNLFKGVKNMKAVVLGEAELRDPITGDIVAVNLPSFYSDPPKSLGELLPTSFESGDAQKTIKNKKGENLYVRNYLRGRSLAWDNKIWQKYIPSAAGKSAEYMAEARRIIQYSFGTSMVFGLPEMFVD